MVDATGSILYGLVAMSFSWRKYVVKVETTVLKLIVFESEFSHFSDVTQSVDTGSQREW